MSSKQNDSAYPRTAPPPGHPFTFNHSDGHMYQHTLNDHSTKSDFNNTYNNSSIDSGNTYDSYNDYNYGSRTAGFGARGYRGMRGYYGRYQGHGRYKEDRYDYDEHAYAYASDNRHDSHPRPPYSEFPEQATQHIWDEGKEAQDYTIPQGHTPRTRARANRGRGHAPQQAWRERGALILAGAQSEDVTRPAWDEYTDSIDGAYDDLVPHSSPSESPPRMNQQRLIEAHQADHSHAHRAIHPRRNESSSSDTTAVDDDDQLEDQDAFYHPKAQSRSPRSAYLTLTMDDDETEVEYFDLTVA